MDDVTTCTFQSRYPGLRCPSPAANQNTCRHRELLVSKLQFAEVQDRKRLLSEHPELFDVEIPRGCRHLTFLSLCNEFDLHFKTLLFETCEEFLARRRTRSSCHPQLNYYEIGWNITDQWMAVYRAIEEDYRTDFDFTDPTTTQHYLVKVCDLTIHFSLEHRRELH